MGYGIWFLFSFFINGLLLYVVVANCNGLIAAWLEVCVKRKCALVKETLQNGCSSCYGSLLVDCIGRHCRGHSGVCVSPPSAAGANRLFSIEFLVQ